MIFEAVLLSSMVSLLFYILLTNVAVIGDRSWQFAFMILLPMLFIKWEARRKLLIPLFLSFILVFISSVNVLYRYPLSNFFTPFFPSIVLKDI